MEDLESLCFRAWHQASDIKLKFEKVRVANVVEMISQLSNYVCKEDGDIKAVSWAGMPDNPLEFCYRMSFRSADLTIRSHRAHPETYELDENNNPKMYRLSNVSSDPIPLHTLEVEIRGEKPVGGIARALCLRFFRKYMMPQEKPVQ